MVRKKKKRLSLSSRINLWFYHATVGIVARIRPPRPRRPELTPASRVLVFSSAGLGDSLLDSPAFRALDETFPGIHIEAVAHHRRPDISRHNPLIKKLHLLRKGPPAFFRLLRDLRASGPWDAILYLSCLDPEARSLGYLLSPDVTIGLAWRTEMPHLCAWNINEPGLRSGHISHQALRAAAVCGAHTGYPRMIYQVSSTDREALDKRLEELGHPLTPRVIFQLGGGGAAFRDWPVEHFAALARELHARNIGPIFLLGGPDHQNKSETLVSLVPEIPLVNVTGKLELPLSAALIERAPCLVSTDTGIMHLGFALGTPTVALLHCQLGRSVVGPLADLDKHEILELPRPAVYNSPADAPMSALLPDQVLPAIIKALARAV